MLDADRGISSVHSFTGCLSLNGTRRSGLSSGARDGDTVARGNDDSTGASTCVACTTCGVGMSGDTDGAMGILFIELSAEEVGDVDARLRDSFVRSEKFFPRLSERSGTGYEDDLRDILSAENKSRTRRILGFEFGRSFGGKVVRASRVSVLSIRLCSRTEGNEVRLCTKDGISIIGVSIDALRLDDTLGIRNRNTPERLRIICGISRSTSEGESNE